MKKLGIVVPFRNRWEHYNEFLEATTLYLIEKGYDYRVIIVEQDDAQAFNRGMLCNIGFLQAKKLKCDYVVFHDIDMIPEDIDYSYSNIPVHLASQDLPFESYFGGITLFPVETFEKVNGFSNYYWGWGFEDDDLRYRCINGGVEFERNINTLTESNDKSVVFNGVNSYAQVPNLITFLRDFTIELQVKLDRAQYNLEKNEDIFTILHLQSKYPLSLQYNSFKRIAIQLFDTGGRFYQIYTEPLGTNVNTIKIEYVAADRAVSLTVNENLVKTIYLQSRLYNYKKAENITIGADSKFKNYFKGSIDYLIIKDSNNQYVSEYSAKRTNRYVWEDLTGQENYGKLHNVLIKNFKPPINFDGYIPFRRESKYRKLTHVNNGFEGGRWKDDLTRWNQLRYNNEVINGAYKDTQDGLSTCQYITHSKKVNKRITHIKVGIN